MSKYRKKPVIVEAERFGGLNKKRIEEFMGVPLKYELESETAFLAGQGPPIFSLIIPTLEGDMKAMLGDWIIKGVKGEFYPCKPDIFESTYELVDEIMEGESLIEYLDRVGTCNNIENLDLEDILKDLKQDPIN